MAGKNVKCDAEKVGMINSGVGVFEIDTFVLYRRKIEIQVKNVSTLDRAHLGRRIV